MSSTAVWDDTVALPRVVLAPTPDRARTTSRRPPAAVLAAGSLAVLESVGLLALGLTSLGALRDAGLRPPGALVAVTLVLLAGWVVLAAASGAVLVDGAGHRLLTGVAVGELVLLAVLVVAGAGGDLSVGGPALPVPGLALLASAVPLTKLLLGTGTTARAWTATTRRAARTPRPPVQHRAVRAVTVAGIGLALTALSVLGPPAPDGAPAPTGTSAAP